MRNKDSIIEFELVDEHICKIELDLDKCPTRDSAEDSLKNMLIRVSEYIDWHYSEDL